MQITITYNWWHDDHDLGGPIDEKHAEVLEETAMERIHEMMGKGFTSGELNDNIRMHDSDPEDGISYRGWWVSRNNNGSRWVTFRDGKKDKITLKTTTPGVTITRTVIYWESFGNFATARISYKGKKISVLTDQVLTDQVLREGET